MSSPDLAQSPATSRLRGIATAVLMMVAVIAAYCPWAALRGESVIYGADHAQLHARRMAFAREAIFGPAHTLPAWYPREAMGTPFRANLQNFPLIPTRLLVVLLFDPQFAFEISAVASAALAAVFTFLLCRRFGLSRIAAAVGGWTFGCCGFFAARVLAGHLPLLEAFPALPALLWLTDRAMAVGDRRRFDWTLIALALAVTCFALAGHPQLVVYALFIAAAFALVRGMTMGRPGRTITVMGAICLGLGVGGAALYPMALLTGRSTRVLELDRADNDLAMPFGRLPAMLLPWRDGWPSNVQRTPNVPFTGYTVATFWDTHCYIGWLPWIGLGWLILMAMRRRQRIGTAGAFIAAIGAGALLLALPPWQNLMSILPGTFLRSPARLMYVVDFALAMALACAIDAAIRRAAELHPTRERFARWAAGAAIGLAIVAHAADLGSHVRAFVGLVPADRDPFPQQQLAALVRFMHDGRAGFDFELGTPINRAIDDVGFFDSLILARPYQFILESGGMAPRLNTQAMRASEMSARTLRACGVRVIWTRRNRADLTRIGEPSAGVLRFAVPDPAERCEFFSLERVRFAGVEQIHTMLRDPAIDLREILLLPADRKPASQPFAMNELRAEVRYRRPSHDAIEVDVTTNQHGYVRLLETWDPGWEATLDGAPIELLAGDDTFLTVAVTPGSRQLRLRYRTPGAAAGAGISIASAVMLAGLAALRRRTPAEARGLTPVA